MNVEWMKHHKKEIMIFACITVLCFGLQFRSSMNEKEKYIQKNNQIIAIQRNDLLKNEKIPITAELIEGDNRRSIQMVITLNDEEDVSASSSKEDMSRDILCENEIRKIEDELSQKKENTIILPLQLSDGTPILWKAPSCGTDFLVLLLFPLGLLYLYQNEIAQKKRMQQKKYNEIQKALPAFNDQLLLLMNSGLIFHDAFYRIIENLKKREEKNHFAVLILDVAASASSTEQNLVSALKSSAKDIGVREYSRLVNIIADNQYKGVDLEDKLESESHLLWESRKSSFMKKGKELDTKLTFPLAVLLMVLIIIAGVPAMMNMY